MTGRVWVRCNHWYGGPPCHDCGRAVWYNAWVSDEVWERVRPEPGPPGGGGVLCAHCIDRRCAEAGIETSVRMHWTGEALKPEDSDELVRLRVALERIALTDDGHPPLGRRQAAIVARDALNPETDG